MLRSWLHQGAKQSKQVTISSDQARISACRGGGCPKTFVLPEFTLEALGALAVAVVLAHNGLGVYARGDLQTGVHER